jgi:hypothetical protein
LAFFAQNTASCFKNLIITLVFEKNANFFAQNSQKIAIITSTPGPFFDQLCKRTCSGQVLKHPRTHSCQSFWVGEKVLPQVSTFGMAAKRIRDRCYDFKNIFAEKFGGKIGVFDSKQS